jgi:hypothetical protein
MATTNLSIQTLGEIDAQSGNGAPDHVAAKGSYYTDIDTSYRYVNLDGAVKWGGADANMPQATILHNAITPPALTANVNDWNPTGLSTANVIMASTDGSNFDITGIKAQEEGRKILLINSGSSGKITLKNNSANSIAANRFILRINALIQENEGVELIYKTGWKVISRF